MGVGLLPQPWLSYWHKGIDQDALPSIYFRILSELFYFFLRNLALTESTAA